MSFIPIQVETRLDSPQLLSCRSPARAPVIRASGAVGLVTIAAIDGSVIARLKGDMRLMPTVRTGGLIHGACIALAKPTAMTAKGISLPTTRVLACGTACWTAARLIGQPLARIKFLLTGGKRKCLVAVAARQGSISPWHLFFSILGSSPS
jgi:hypothetical protein